MFKALLEQLCCRGRSSFRPCLIMVICLFPTLVVASSGSPARALQHLLGTMQSVDARFSQSLRNQQGQWLEQSQGRFRLKKPAKLYWEIEGEDARLIVSNGQKVWDFDKVLEQVIVQNLATASGGTPLLLLSGDFKNLHRAFSVQYLPSKNNHCLKQSTACFVLYPKNKEDQPFEKIAIGFKKDQLQEMQLFDPLGQCSEIIFNDLRLNPPLSDALFSFKIPPNVDILRNDR